VGAIRRSERESLTDPRSGLPAGRLIEEQLRRIIRAEDWALLDIRVEYLDPFREVYGFVAGDNVLRFTGMLITSVVDDLGTSEDFIGHAGADDFIVITNPQAAPRIREKLKDRFAAEILAHYSFVDREKGFIEAPGKNGKPHQVPFMKLSVGMIAAGERTFSDIREITEVAAEARRGDAVQSSEGVQ
jgi:GGDEF domain-containing protein